MDRLVKGVWLCDAKSVQEHLTRDVGNVSCKRLAIEAAALRQLARRPGQSILWIDTTAQLADVLTKDMEADTLERVLVSNVYSCAATASGAEAKVRARAARETRRAKERGL